MKYSTPNIQKWVVTESNFVAPLFDELKVSYCSENPWKLVKDFHNAVNFMTKGSFALFADDMDSLHQLPLLSFERMQAIPQKACASLHPLNAGQ